MCLIENTMSSEQPSSFTGILEFLVENPIDGPKEPLENDRTRICQMIWHKTKPSSALIPF